jgi:DNA-binding transcriptional LysR family regulator
MKLHLTRLAQLRAFEAVARCGGFKAAAEELAVTPSALSHHVARLEGDLGIALLTRLHRRVVLTDDGRRLFAECTVAMEALAGALQRLARASADAPLVLNVAPYFSAQWLTPRLARLWSQEPGLDLRLHHAYQPVDFARDAVDAGICWGDGRWKGARCSLLLQGRLTAVCSPALCDALGPAPKPRDLLGQRLLHEFDASHWNAWFAAARVKPNRPLALTRIDDSHALRRAALDGHGVALFFSGLLHDDLASRRLCAPFPIEIDSGAAYYFVEPRGRPAHPRIKGLAAWLAREAAAPL